MSLLRIFSQKRTISQIHEEVMFTCMIALERVICWVITCSWVSTWVHKDLEILLHCFMIQQEKCSWVMDVIGRILNCILNQIALQKDTKTSIKREQEDERKQKIDKAGNWSWLKIIKNWNWHLKPTNCTKKEERRNCMQESKQRILDWEIEWKKEH